MPSASRRPATCPGSRLPAGRSAAQLGVAVLMASAGLFWTAAQTPARAATTAGRGGASSWHIAATPVLAPDNALSSIAVVGKRLAWAAGVEGYSGDGKTAGGPLLLRWSGSRWSRARLPGSWSGGLAAVAASSAANAWALRKHAAAAKIAPLLHWNRPSWHNTPPPNIRRRSHADP